YGQGDAGVRALGRDVVDQVAGGLDVAAVDRGDDVTVNDAGLGGRGAGHHVADQRAVGRGEAERLRVGPVEVLDVDAEVAAADVTLVAQLREDLPGGGDRHRAAD